MLYFEHDYKFRTILYSLEPKNYIKLWVHGNWGRTETGDTTVLCKIQNDKDDFDQFSVHTVRLITSLCSDSVRQWIALDNKERHELNLGSYELFKITHKYC